MKKILVTGGAGYIGSVATYLLLQKDFEVVVVDNLSTGHKEPLLFFENKFGKKKFRYYETDLRKSLDFIFKEESGIDAVLHYAASCMVNESMENPQKYFSNNVCGTQNLLTTLLKYNVKNIVFSSTCETYGEVQYVPVDEEHPSNSVTPYGISKSIVERIVRTYGDLKLLNYVIFRYFNVCGASDDGEIGDSKKPSVLLVQNAVKGALGIEPFFLTYREVGTPDGTPIRDYINVVDLNEAHIKALEYLLGGGKNEIINLGTGDGNSVLEIVDKVQKITNVKFKARRSDPRKGEPSKLIADIKKAKRVLDWSPERSIENSVKSLIKWYTKHPKGWEG
ncbi:MAG: UDP-galactose 4-epimerase [Candidatus Woesebacteria bacterium GW2011_GWA1_39_8]|jgi:UDP-glucose 4-epimerase|uniref:UDP-glucose 4-epimerase n=1 Tax=Candidatus Woesebacteria bacterium GW2011_GWA1_39_8 TaxID=1618552 RepID=A0A0G0PUW0_9BACT|nr:MAG: UDP-galactose 4-epimerase [Candidatus Woesebacteria bacterium GW2011_GWA1_39_8]